VRVAIRALVLGLVLSVMGAHAALAGGNEPPTPTATLDCQMPISSAVSPPKYVAPFGGAVALQTSAPNRRAIQTSFDPREASAWRYFAKSPLFVRTGDRTAEIRIPQSGIGHVAITWGNTDHNGLATQRLAVGPCSGDPRWIVFPGGLYVDKPHCVKLVVRVSGRDHAMAMGVGSPCGGQRPPARQSDP
jgi:hypothetical protein